MTGVVEIGVAMRKRGNVGEQCIAHFCAPIPAEQGSKGLAKLGAARFVDATGISPYEGETVVASLRRTALDLVIACFGAGVGSGVQHFLICDFIRTPRVGEDGIR